MFDKTPALGRQTYIQKQYNNIPLGMLLQSDVWKKTDTTVTESGVPCDSWCSNKWSALTQNSNRWTDFVRIASRKHRRRPTTSRSLRWSNPAHRDSAAVVSALPGTGSRAYRPACWPLTTTQSNMHTHRFCHICISYNNLQPTEGNRRQSRM